MNERQKILRETAAARERAEALLRGLLEASSRADAALGETSDRPDPMKLVTGSTSLERAIDSTKRVIESFDRVLEQFQNDLTDEDLKLLEEGDEGERR